MLNNGAALSLVYAVLLGRAKSAGKGAWVGVDLDGTLAEAGGLYTENGCYDLTHVGKPVQAILTLVKDLLAAGVQVKIFTARVEFGAGIYRPIEIWMGMQGLPCLPITNKKDLRCVGLVDDIAFGVAWNQGRLRGSASV